MIDNQVVQAFVRECVELCWLMVLQDPAVVIGDAPCNGVDFDTNIFKPYTQTGPKFDYMVWPPLYLHKDGPLLERGVAQAFGKELVKDRRRNKNSPDTVLSDETTSSEPLSQNKYYRHHFNEADPSDTFRQRTIVSKESNVDSGMPETSENFDRKRQEGNSVGEISNVDVENRVDALLHGSYQTYKDLGLNTSDENQQQRSPLPAEPGNSPMDSLQKQNNYPGRPLRQSVSNETYAAKATLPLSTQTVNPIVLTDYDWSWFNYYYQLNDAAGARRALGNEKFNECYWLGLQKAPPVPQQTYFYKY